MSYRKIITMTHAFRPEYTSAVIDALAKCDGIEEYKIIACVDPGNDEVPQLLEAIKFTEKQVIVHPQHIGCDANILFALSCGFDHSDYVIQIEDDIVFAKDALKFFEHCRTAYEADKSVFTATAYSRLSEMATPDMYHLYNLRQWFHPWGWATWADRFIEMQSKWQIGGQWHKKLNRRVGSCWDTELTRVRDKRYEVYPLLSRAQNIGEQMGCNVSPEYHRKHQYLKFWAGQVEIQEGVWQKGDLAAGPTGPVR